MKRLNVSYILQKKQFSDFSPYTCKVFSRCLFFGRSLTALNVQQRMFFVRWSPLQRRVHFSVFLTATIDVVDVHGTLSHLFGFDF